MEADPGQLRQAALGLAEGGQQLGGVLVGELGELGLDLRAQHHRVGGGDQGGELLEPAGVGEGVLVHVEHVQERFGRQQEQLPQRRPVHTRLGREGATGVEHLTGVLHGGEQALPALVDPGLLLQSGQARVDGLQVGEDELGVDGGDVVGGVDPAVHVDDVRVGEDPDDLADRVRLTDVGQEPVPEPLPLGGAADQARDVDEAHRRRHRAGTVEDLGEPVEAGVGNPDDADVRLDGGERVVRGQHVVAGQRVEQGRLADVG